MTSTLTPAVLGVRERLGDLGRAERRRPGRARCGRPARSPPPPPAPRRRPARSRPPRGATARARHPRSLGPDAVAEASPRLRTTARTRARSTETSLIRGDHRTTGNRHYPGHFLPGRAILKEPWTRPCRDAASSLPASEPRPAPSSPRADRPGAGAGPIPHRQRGRPRPVRRDRPRPPRGPRRAAS